MGTLTASSLAYESSGSEKKVQGTFAFSTSYNNTSNDATTGETITAAALGLNRITRLKMQPEKGYDFEALGLGTGATSVRVKAFSGGAAAGNTGAEAAHTHAVALDSGASGAGSSHGHAFTGTSEGSLNLATPAFSGTGLTAAGQVMTTTDNQTMTLNQCAGMWLLPATAATPPMLIVSNTAVTGAPAVLTVIGAAATDAGAYKIVKNIVPTGSNAAEATHTHGAGTLADAASGTGSSHLHAISASAGGEVANATNLYSAGLTAVEFEAYGF